MPIGLGLASSHAPGMYTTPQVAYEGLQRQMATAAEKELPMPSALATVTLDVLEARYGRYRDGHTALRQQLEQYNPDALIIVAGDQSEMFDDTNRVNMMIYTGAESFGYNSAQMRSANVTEPEDRFKVTFQTDVELAQWLAHELVSNEGFDIAVSEEMHRLGNTRVPGLPHPFVNPAEIMPRPDLPVVLLYVNTYDPPAFTSGTRCYELGVAIAKVLQRQSKRVAIYGSGGLSHSLSDRRFWVDEPLDHWFLDQISQGTGYNLKEMYDVPSMTLESGTGENRAWIVVAGAMEHLGVKATVVDYITAHETLTGNGFAYWMPPGN